MRPFKYFSPALKRAERVKDRKRKDIRWEQKQEATTNESVAPALICGCRRFLAGRLYETFKFMSSLDSPSSGFTQLAGHLGSVSTTEDGSLIIKQASPLEQEFYSIMVQARAMDPDSSDSPANEEELLHKLRRLSRFVPEFYGTLRLEGEMDIEAMGSVPSDDAYGMVLKPVPPDADSGLARDEFFTIIHTN